MNLQQIKDTFEIDNLARTIREEISSPRAAAALERLVEQVTAAREAVTELEATIAELEE
jgi:PHD/YefM family antitoxin component YafN of YafNO toxin-antitoxin module